jgi:hypothetical protein
MARAGMSTLALSQSPTKVSHQQKSAAERSNGWVDRPGARKVFLWTGRQNHPWPTGFRTLLRHFKKGRWFFSNVAARPVGCGPG